MKANKPMEGTLCPICNVALNLGDEVAVCTACETVHHAGCWDQNEGCSKNGCVNAPFKQVEDKAAELEDKQAQLKPHEMICPHCHNVIRRTERCPKCYRFTTPDGLYHGTTSLLPRARNALIMGIVGIFIFGIILGPASIHYARKAKEEIRSDYHYHGEGVATAAEIVGWIAVIGWALLMCARFSG